VGEQHLGQKQYFKCMKMVMRARERRDTGLSKADHKALRAALQAGSVGDFAAVRARAPQLSVRHCLGSGFGTSLLHHCADHDHPELMEHLLAMDPAAARACAGLRDLGGDTPLLCAVRALSLGCVSLLLRGGFSNPSEATRNPCIQRRYSGLHMALSSDCGSDMYKRPPSESNAFSILKLLCEAGAQVNARSRQSWSPLFKAVHGAPADVVDYLLNERPTKAPPADLDLLYGGPGEPKVSLLYAADWRCATAYSKDSAEVVRLVEGAYTKAGLSTNRKKPSVDDF
jgi:hypothetical protein